MISMETFAKSGSFSRQITDQRGVYSVLEYNKLSGYAAVNPVDAFYRAKQGVRKKQVLVQLRGGNGIILQAGAMQMMLGNIVSDANIGGVGGLVRGIFSAQANKESAVKPKYSGDGIVVLEPTWKYILLEDLSEWGGSMVLDDGLFLSCEASVGIRTVARNNLSSAIAGGEGLFNTMLTGSGVVCLESNVPRDELICIDLNNDTVKIDGNMAIAWSGSLQFTVERSMKGLIGSAMSGEGLVNVYRGTGRILVAAV